MDTLKFQTNINSEEKLAKAALVVDKLEGVAEWTVDVDSLYHLLTVKGVGIDALKVISVLEAAGFTVLQLFEE
ncbi:hypothetical protein FW774_07755 [Pedobacter sp. BS3]|uniref:hypothetical protein n=1 Tax=Pedobacter sp. BS3 TaxID=2567937 RepID=UPI0011F0453D|nr:hypothetical protein [Pedobacter sp. BS3]TZF84863.1 hypothetical protein FW774_07755 [Pedobacter sp. BS3]